MAKDTKKPQAPPEQPVTQVPGPAEPDDAKEYLSSREEDGEVEQASEDSFPASDPPSFTPVRQPGKPKRP